MASWVEGIVTSSKRYWRDFCPVTSNSRSSLLETFFPSTSFSSAPPWRPWPLLCPLRTGSTHWVSISTFPGLFCAANSAAACWERIVSRNFRRSWATFFSCSPTATEALSRCSGSSGTSKISGAWLPPRRGATKFVTQSKRTTHFGSSSRTSDRVTGGSPPSILFKWRARRWLKGPFCKAARISFICECSSLFGMVTFSLRRRTCRFRHGTRDGSG
mmetsp:Transcript_28909/g.62864  ORF Transcript_28909/g.62864 Transcript_28909/m.62864 type:complete len:216 (-) Transcript_28909:326-973(-)